MNIGVQENIYIIGALSSEDQGILVNWYNNLTSKGNLNWNVKSDLCKQGVGCDNSKPNQRATALYSFIF